MGRNNGDFQEQALYHGSTHPFEIGDTVLPFRAINGWGGHDREVAYATTRMPMAQAHAKTTGKVFTVEPLDNEEAYKSEDGQVVTSRLGFRVIGKVGD